MALPRVKTFSGTDSTTVASNDTEFTDEQDTLDVVSNNYTIENAAAGPAIVRFNAETATDAHSSAFTMAAVTNAADWIGAGVRSQTGAGTGYALNGSGYSGTDSYLVEVIANTQRVIDSADNDDWSVGNVGKISIDGTTISPTKDAATITSFTATYAGESGISGGEWSINGYASANNTGNRVSTVTFDNVGGGGGGTILPLIMSYT